MTIDTKSSYGCYRNSGIALFAWRLSNHRIFSAKTRRRLRKLLARHFPGPFDHEVSDIKWRLYPEQNYCDRIIFSRDHLPEQAEHKALAELIRPGMCFVDVGSNVGTYALFIAKMSGYGARVLALEPQPETYQKLLFNLKINGAQNVLPLQVACGPEKTSMRLWSGVSNIGHTSLLEQGASNNTQAFDVQVVPLLDIVREQGIERIDVLKIDVEGFEDQVLVPYFASADKTLWPRHVLIETAHAGIWQDDVIALMKSSGYKAIFETKENLLFKL